MQSTSKITLIQRFFNNFNKMSLYRSFYNNNSNTKNMTRTAAIALVAAFAFVAGAQSSQMEVGAVKLTIKAAPRAHVQLAPLEVPDRDAPVPEGQRAELEAELETPTWWKQHTASEAAAAARSEELKALEGGEGHLYHLKPSSSLKVLATLTEPVAGEPTIMRIASSKGKAVPGHGPLAKNETVVVGNTVKMLAAASPPAGNTHGKEGLTRKQKLRIFWVVMAILVLIACAIIGAGYGILKGLEGTASVGVASQAS